MIIADGKDLRLRLYFQIEQSFRTSSQQYVHMLVSLQLQAKMECFSVLCVPQLCTSGNDVFSNFGQFSDFFFRLFRSFCLFTRMTNIFIGGLVLNALNLDKHNICSINLLGIASQSISFEGIIIDDANSRNVFSYFSKDDHGFWNIFHVRNIIKQ